MDATWILVATTDRGNVGRPPQFRRVDAHGGRWLDPPHAAAAPRIDAIALPVVAAPPRRTMALRSTRPFGPLPRRDADRHPAPPASDVSSQLGP